MDTDFQTAKTSLVARAKALILSPNTEWLKIAGEDTPTRDIFIGYVIPLSLIAPVAGVLGGQIFGYSVMGIGIEQTLVSAVILGVVTFVLSLINLLVMTLIADFLSPKFGGELSNYKSFKLVAYSATASWLVGIFGLVPALGIFGLLGLYSIYLLYVGAEPMLGIPKAKRVGFTITVMLCALLLNFVVAGLSSMNMKMLAGMGLLGEQQHMTMTLPDGTKINSAEIEKMADELEEATKK